MIYSVLTKSMFMDAFRAYDRFDSFGYEALSELYDYYMDFEEPMELDVVAICCDWNVVHVNFLEQETGCASFDDLTSETIAFELSNNTVLYAVF